MADIKPPELTQSELITYREQSVRDLIGLTENIFTQLRFPDGYKPDLTFPFETDVLDIIKTEFQIAKSLEYQDEAIIAVHVVLPDNRSLFIRTFQDAQYTNPNSRNTTQPRLLSFEVLERNIDQSDEEGFKVFLDMTQSDPIAHRVEVYNNGQRTRINYRQPIQISDVPNRVETLFNCRLTFDRGSNTLPNALNSSHLMR